MSDADPLRDVDVLGFGGRRCDDAVGRLRWEYCDTERTLCRAMRTLSESDVLQDCACYARILGGRLVNVIQEPWVGDSGTLGGRFMNLHADEHRPYELNGAFATT